ncbi:MAG: hypothetical protein LR015_14200 [Verrucomicrobia bacterium]|nr:hypothetical protein [Verrucomicrobiota bacterium]
MKITTTLISLSTLGLLLFTGCASDPVGKMSLNDAVMTGNRTAALADLREKESKVPARDRLQFLLQKGQLGMG